MYGNELLGQLKCGTLHLYACYLLQLGHYRQLFMNEERISVGPF